MSLATEASLPDPTFLGLNDANEFKVSELECRANIMLWVRQSSFGLSFLASEGWLLGSLEKDYI